MKKYDCCCFAIIFLNIFWFCSACAISYFLFGDIDTIFNFKGDFIVNSLLFLSYIIFVLVPLFLSSINEIKSNKQKKE